MLKPYVDGSAIRDGLKQVKELDPKMYRQMRSDIRKPSKDLGQKGAAAFPGSDPLSNFWRSKMSQYESAPNVSVSISPGSEKAKNFSKLISIVLKTSSPGYSLAENVDDRRVTTARGHALVRNLEALPKAKKLKRGRFAFATIMEDRKELIEAITRSIEDWTQKASKEFEK